MIPDPNEGQLYPYPVPEEICEYLDYDFGIEIPILGIPNYDLVEEMMKALKSLLSPAMPFFRVLDALIQLVRCVQEIPQAIITLSPTEIFRCLAELASKIAKLMEMLPWVAGPLMIVKIIDLLIAIMTLIITRLEWQLEKLRRLLAAIDRAADLDNGPLQDLLTCEHANMQSRLDEEAEILRGIGQVIGVCNLVLEIAGVPDSVRIPSLVAAFDASSEASLQEGIDYLKDFRDLLRIVRDAVPIP